jgi:hypothetical protein
MAYPLAVWPGISAEKDTDLVLSLLDRLREGDDLRLGLLYHQLSLIDVA